MNHEQKKTQQPCRNQKKRMAKSIFSVHRVEQADFQRDLKSAATIGLHHCLPDDNKEIAKKKTDRSKKQAPNNNF